MFFNRRRVEEDLERIRKANLPMAGEAEGASKETKVVEERIGVKDILAMIIAIFSLILPYVLAFVVLMGIILVFFYNFLG